MHERGTQQAAVGQQADPVPQQPARRHGGAGLPDGTIKVRIEVEVSNFYPSIAAGFSTPVYEATQSVIHVLVTHSFLRSLATLDLAESKVGRLAAVSQPSEEEVAAAAAQNGDSAVADAGQGAELGAVMPSEHSPHGP